MKLKVLFIDNFDSFTYNLVEEFEKMDADIQVVRNDVSLTALEATIAEVDLIVLSPGPGDPQSAGICLSLIEQYRGKKPILGICLGHQAIVEASGGKIERTAVPVHGKVSRMTHDDLCGFKGLPNPVPIGRYHSLIASELPSSLRCIAKVDDLVMAVYDEQTRMLGLQFHPESILTPHGAQLLKNTVSFLAA